MDGPNIYGADMDTGRQRQGHAVQHDDWNPGGLYRRQRTIIGGYVF
jgi:hypothetical protein